MILIIDDPGKVLSYLNVEAKNIGSEGMKATHRASRTKERVKVLIDPHGVVAVTKSSNNSVLVTSGQVEQRLKGCFMGRAAHYSPCVVEKASKQGSAWLTPLSPLLLEPPDW